jgi:hypothetical protein
MNGSVIGQAIHYLKALFLFDKNFWLLFPNITERTLGYAGIGDGKFRYF